MFLVFSSFSTSNSYCLNRSFFFCRWHAFGPFIVINFLAAAFAFCRSTNIRALRLARAAMEEGKQGVRILMRCNNDLRAKTDSPKLDKNPKWSTQDEKLSGAMQYWTFLLTAWKRLCLSLKSHGTFWWLMSLRAPCLLAVKLVSLAACRREASFSTLVVR